MTAGSRRSVGRRILRGLSIVVETVAVLALLVGVLAFGRSSLGSASTSGAPSTALAADASGAADATGLPSSPPERAVTQSLEPVTTEPTGSPSASPSPSTSPSTSPSPTVPAPRRTPKPVVSGPDPTPVYLTASGAYGDTLTVRGIRVRAVLAQPDQQFAGMCVSTDPERQGWTELVAVEATIWFPSEDLVQVPLYEIGAHPNLGAFTEEATHPSGVPYLVTMCHQPGDNLHLRVLMGTSGTPMTELYWLFR